MSTHIYRIDDGGAERNVILIRQDTDTDYYPGNAPEVSPIILITGTGQIGPDLTAIELLTGIDVIYYRSAVNTWSPVTIGSGITFSGGILSAQLTGALDPDLNSIAAASGTNTIYYRSADNTWSAVTIGSGLYFSGGNLVSSGIIGNFQPYHDNLQGLSSLTGENIIYYRTGAGISGWLPVTFNGLSFTNGQLAILTGSTSDLTGINVIHYRPNSGSWTDVKHTYAISSPGVPPLDVYLSTTSPLSGHMLTRALFNSADSTFLNYSNGIFVVFNNTGGLGPASGAFAVSIVNGGTSANSATQARINLGLEIGDDVQAWDADLDSLSNLSQRGVYYRETGSNWRLVLPSGDYGSLNYKGVLLTTGGGAYLPPNSGYLVSLGMYDAGIGEYISAYNSGFVVSNYTGQFQRPFIIDIAHGGTSATGASGARANLGLAIGTDIQAWDDDLTSLSNASFTNVFYYRSGAGVWSPVTIGSGLSFISGTLTSSTSGGGGASQPLDGDLTSLSNASSVNVIYYRSAADMWDPLVITTGLVLADGRLYASGQASLTTLPVANLIGTVAISQGGTSATSASGALSNLSGQPLDGDLTAISNLNGSGILYYRSGANTWSNVIFGTGLSFISGTIVLSGAGNFQPLDGDLTNISNLNGSGIIYYRSGNNNWLPVTIGSGLSFNSGVLIGSGIVGLINITGATTGTLPIVRGGTNATTASGARVQLGLVIGTDVQAWDADLDSLSAASNIDTIYYRASANTWSPITVSTGLNFQGGTLTSTFPYINIRDYGATGNGIIDDSSSIQTAANVAKSLNARLIAPIGTYLIASDVDLRQTNIDFTSSVLRLTGSTTKLIIGGTSQKSTNPPQKFFDIQRTGGATSTPTVQVIGAKGQYIGIDRTDYIQFYADTASGDSGPDASIAYSRFDLTQATRIELNTNFSTPNSTTQWINENSFFVKRCTELISSGTYHHNHNYFYNGNYEDCNINFAVGADNIIMGARFEGTCSVAFGTGTFANKIFYGYESNQRTQYDDLITPTVIDSGEGNTIGSIAQSLQFRQPVVIVNSTTCHSFSNNAGSVGGRGPNYTTLEGVDVQPYGVDTFHRTSNRQVYDSPLIRVGRGEALSFSSDRNLFRGSLKIYDNTKTLITDSDINAGSYLRTSAGLAWDASSNAYISSSNRSNFLAINLHDKVNYIKFDVNAGSSTTSVPFSGFALQKITFGVSAQKLFEESLHQSSRIAAVSSMPTIGFAPEVGMKVGGLLGGAYTATSALDTTLSSGSSIGSTTVVLNSVAGIASGDVISIRLDDGSTDWTKVNGTPVGNAVTLLVGLTSAAASGNRATSNTWVTDSGSAASLDGDLTALGALEGTNTIYYRSATNTWSAVNISTGLNFSGGNLYVTGNGLLLTGLNASNLVIGTVSSSRGGAGSISGILKADGAGNVSAATSGIDYMPADSDLISLANSTGSDAVYYRVGDGDWRSTIHVGNPPLDVYIANSGTLSGHLLSRALYNYMDDTFLAYSGSNLIIYNNNGAYSSDFILPVIHGGTNATTVAGARSSLGLVIGSDVQAYNVDLDGLSNLTGTGLMYYRVQTGIWAPVAMGSGMSFYSGMLIASGHSLDPDLNALAALTGIHTVYYRSADSTWTPLQFVSGVTFVDDKIFASGSATLLNLPVGNLVGTLDITQGGTSATSASEALTNLGAQAQDGDLDALSNIGGTGLYYRSGTNVWSPVTIGSGLQFNISNGLLIASGTPHGIPSGLIIPIESGGTSSTTQAAARINLGLEIGNDVQGFDTDLASLANANLTGVIYYRSGAGSWHPITPTSGLYLTPNGGLLGITGFNINDINLVGMLPVSKGGTSATNPSDARYQLGLEIGTDIQAYDLDLNSLANANQIDRIYYRSGAGDWHPVTIGSGLVFSNGSLVSSGAIGSFQPLDGDLTSLSSASSTNAIYYRSATDTWNPITIGQNLGFSNGTLSGSGGSHGLPAGTIIPIESGGTNAINASDARQELGLEIGVDIQAWDSDLHSLANANQTGVLYYRSGSGNFNWHPVTIGSGLFFNANIGLLISSGAIGSFQPLDDDLTAISNLAGTHNIYHRSAAGTWTSTNFISGVVFGNTDVYLSGTSNLLNIPASNLLGTLSIGMGGTSATNAATALANLGGQPIDSDLTSISALSQTGTIYYRSGNGVWSPITIGSGLSFNATSGILISSGIIGSFQPLDGDLTAISNLNGTNTIYYRLATDTWSAVTVSSGLQFNNGIMIVSGNGSLLEALNASNITHGVVSSNFGGAGSINGILKANGAGVVSAAGADVDYQSADADLISLASANQTGVIYYRSGNGNWSPVTIGSGLFFNANIGELISSGQPLDGDLTSLSNASSTNALYYRSATDTWSPVTIGVNLGFSNGILSGSGVVAGLPSGTIIPIQSGGTNATTAAGALSNLGGQPLDSDLTSLSNASQTGVLYYRSGVGVWSPIIIGSGLGFNANIGILTSSGGLTANTGTIAVQNANNIDIRGGTIQGISSLSVNGTVGISNNLNVVGVISGNGAYITGISAFNITGGDLQAIENLTQTGAFFYRSNTNVWTPVIPASGLFFNSGNGELGARLGSVVQRWDGDLEAISALTGINTIYYRSAVNTWNPVSFGSGVGFLNGVLTFTGTGGISNTNLEVNVLNYGAVGNGVTDDTAAFLLAGGGVPGRRILVPGGYRYRITSTLASALASGQTWYGNGDIITDNGFNFNVFEINNKPDITIFGLTAHGGTLGAAYTAADARFLLAYGNSPRTKVLYCNIYGFQSAALVAAPYCDLSHNTIINTTGWGLFADAGSEGILISYNNISGVKGSYGIFVKGANASNRSKSPTIIGNNVLNGESYGITTNYIQDARIGFNTCSNNTFDGIFLNNGSTRCKIFNNVCDFNDNGIAFYETETTSIRNEFFNNTLRQSSNAGFILNGTAAGFVDSNSISNNQCESNGNYGLVTAGPSSTTFIKDNRFYSESIGILSVGTGDVIQDNEFVDCSENFVGSNTSIVRQFNSFTGIVLNTATGLRQLLLGSGLTVTGGTTLVANVTTTLDADLQALENVNSNYALYFRQSNGVWPEVLPIVNRDIYKSTILSTGGSSVPYSGYLITKGLMDSIQQDFLYIEDDILYSANITGGNSNLFTLDITNGGTAANTVTGARSNLGLIIGTDIQAWDQDLQSLANTSLNNTLYYRSGAGVWTPVTISSGLTFVNGILMSSGRSEVISYVNGGVNNIVRNDAYKHYVNTGTSLTQFLLPSASSGIGPYSFTVDDSDGIHIRAAANDVIRLGPGSITTGNGYIVSTDVGSAVTLISLNDVTWQAKSVVGYWSVS